MNPFSQSTSENAKRPTAPSGHPYSDHDSERWLVRQSGTGLHPHTNKQKSVLPRRDHSGRGPRANLFSGR